MDGAQVGVLEQTHQVGLAGLLPGDMVVGVGGERERNQVIPVLLFPVTLGKGKPL